MEICIKWSMCRTCTSDSSSQLQPLFNDIRLAQQLEEYAGVVAKPDDGLPDKICTECLQNFQSVHTFLTGCKRADAHLRNVVRRTMSTGRCFSSISTDEDTESYYSPVKVGGEARVRKQIISERNPQKKRFKTEPVRTRFSSTRAELETPKSEAIETTQLSDEDLSNSPGSRDVALEAASGTVEKNNDDYLLVVSKCVLQLSEGGATEHEDNEYIITDVPDSDDNENDNRTASYESEPDTITKVPPATKAIEPPTSKNTQSEIEEKATLKLEHIQVDEPASTAALTVDLGAACELLNFPRHSCSLCGNSFPNQTQLKSHLRTHRNEKNYECELCSKRFNAACNLTTHMRTHTGEKPFGCAHCGRHFADRSTHRKHERMHTNERPYACDICGKTFSLSTTLKAHFLSHSQEKPHKCLTCNKGFRLPHQLKAHERTHVHRYESGIMMYNQDEADYSSS